MKRLLPLICFALVASACGRVTYTLRDETPADTVGEDTAPEAGKAKGKKKKPYDRNTVTVEYTGTAEGIERVVAAANTRKATVAAEKVAVTALERGMPASFDASAGGAHAAGSFPWGAYGANGAFSPYFNNGYGVYTTPAVAAAQAASYGASTGGLPPLAYSTAGAAPAGTLIEAVGGKCPTDRIPVALPDRVACLEKTQAILLRRTAHEIR